ncbi:MAG: NRDE family protein [Chromatiales bacterium]|nr:NRDE family protein [Chromatiales bacterium]
MCTLIIALRPGHDWPVVLGANRDERIERESRPPARHWPDRSQVVAGLDTVGGGSWLGVSDWGLVAAVMNRSGTLGPQDGKRSRGELVLEALEHPDARSAALALVDLNPAAYRPFNLFVADAASAHWLRLVEGGSKVEAMALTRGVHMLTARDLNDTHDARIRVHLRRLRSAALPDPDRDDWSDWQRLLASRLHAESDGPGAAMCVGPHDGFGTVSSALVALPRHTVGDIRPRMLYAPVAPESGDWRAIDLTAARV